MWPEEADAGGAAAQPLASGGPVGHHPEKNHLSKKLKYRTELMTHSHNSGSTTIIVIHI